MFPGGDLRALQACDGPADGEAGEACDVLSDGGEVDVGQAGEMAVVEPDDGDVAGDRDAGAEEEVEYAGRAAVVEGQYGGGARAGGRQGSGGLGAFLLSETAGENADVFAQAVAVHGGAVAAPPVGCARCPAAVDVGDVAVAQSDEVVHRLAGSLVVGGPYDFQARDGRP